MLECTFLHQVHLKIHPQKTLPEFQHSQFELLKPPHCEAVAELTQGQGLLQKTDKHQTWKKIQLQMSITQITTGLSKPSKSKHYGKEPTTKWLLSARLPSRLLGHSLPLHDVLCVPPEGTNSWNRSLKAHIIYFKLHEC